MTNIKNIKNIIEGNWEEVKGKIQHNWGKLTDKDIDQINGSYKMLTGKLQSLYGYKAEEIEKEVIHFFNSSEFDKLMTAGKNKIEHIKNIVFESIEEYFQTAKTKTINAEKAILEYVTSNPYKIITISAATGALIGCLCRSNKS